MASWYKSGSVLAMGLVVVSALGSSRAGAQTFERDTTITGPRGRSINRQVDITRTPGGVERDISIRRPAGTFQRETFIGRPGGGGGGGGFRGWAPGPRFGPPVFVGGGGGGGLGPWGAGLLGGALGLGTGMLIGSAATAATAPPPPPPVVVQQPVVVAQPGQVVEYVPPVRYQPAPPPATVVVDPVAQEIARFQSYHESSRVDAAVHLGRLGDARAVSPLVDRLKNDRAKDVRIAAATALGEIGDPSASIYLERAVIYDHRQEVRDAATAAIGKIRQAQLAAQARVQAETTASFNAAPNPAATTRVPVLSPTGSVPPPPLPANGSR